MALFLIVCAICIWLTRRHLKMSELGCLSKFSFRFEKKKKEREIKVWQTSVICLIANNFTIKTEYPYTILTKGGKNIKL